MDGYEEVDTVQAAHAEIVISIRRRGDKKVVVLAPRKSYYDRDDGERKMYIPRGSSIELSEHDQVQELIEALMEVSAAVFGSSGYGSDSQQP